MHHKDKVDKNPSPGYGSVLRLFCRLIFICKRMLFVVLEVACINTSFGFFLHVHIHLLLFVIWDLQLHFRNLEFNYTLLCTIMLCVDQDWL